MLRTFAILGRNFVARSQVSTPKAPIRNFCVGLEDEFKGTVVLREERTGYFQNPENVARRMVKIFAAHESIEAPEEITLGTTFYELRDRGMDDLSKVEIFLMVEREFDLQLPDDQVERFLNVKEAVEYVSKSFHAH
jgi:acyl carrier protein